MSFADYYRNILALLVKTCYTKLNDYMEITKRKHVKCLLNQEIKFICNTFFKKVN